MAPACPGPQWPDDIGRHRADRRLAFPARAPDGGRAAGFWTGSKGLTDG